MAGRLVPFDVVRSVAASRHIVATAVRHGMNAAHCLSGSGLSVADLDDPATAVRAEQELTIVRNVISRLGDRPGLGKEAGSLYTLADTGILGYAMMASPTFGDALRVASRYAGLTPSYFTIAGPQVTGTEAVLEFDTTAAPTDVRHFMLERDLAMLMRLLPTLLRPVDGPITVRVQLNDSARPVEVLAADDLELVVESATRNAVILSAALIERPMPVADAQTAAMCIRQCEDLLNRRLARQGLSASVRTRIIQDSATIPSMAEIAAELCITERTLHRKLLAGGTSFRALLDEVRSTLATEMLDSGLTVEETARRLGYSEAAAFTRAHIRWTGVPPSKRGTRSVSEPRGGQ
jgi:AraC-like DNA-binding protein